jgi:hypothetical protein
LETNTSFILFTNSETTNHNFQELFDQLEQVLQVLQVFFAYLLFDFSVRSNLIGQSIGKNSGFPVSELVPGSGEQKI